MSILRDYSRQARTYDRTRGASPSVLAPMRRALRGAPGRSLVDIGGGTGNYSLALRHEGWRPIVLDQSAAMLLHAAGKGLSVVRGDALALPFIDSTFDVTILIAMLHHTGNSARALAEARRVLRPGGRLAALVFTREDIEENWLVEYFPASRAWMKSSHQPLAEHLGTLPGAMRLEVDFCDVCDASIAALSNYPDLILDPMWRRQTSFFERMKHDHIEELRDGLDRLASDLAAGTRPQGRGIASMLMWSKSA